MVRKKNPAEKQPVVIEDLLKFRYPSNLQYSPEGNALAFTLAEAVEEKNTYRRNVWLIRDGKPCQLTASMDAVNVLWDDDTHLVIQRRTDEAQPGDTQLFIIDINGGEAKPWLTLPIALASLRKIREGLYVASAVIDANDPDAYKDSAETRKKKLQEAEKNMDYTVVDEVPYWFNGKGFTNKKRCALFTVSTENGLKLKRITPPLMDVRSIAADGETVYFTAQTWKTSQTRKEKCYAFRTNTGKTETLYGKNDHSINNLFVLDHELYAQASDMKEYGVNQTGDIVRIKDGTLTFITDPCRATHSSVAGDTTLGGGKSAQVVGNDWYTLVTDVDRVCIWKYNSVFDKEVIFDRPGAMTCMDASASQIAVVREDSQHLCEVYTMDLNGGNFTKVTCFNDAVLADKYVAEPVPLEFTSEGEDLKGWVLLPQGFDPKKKYPAVLDVHGGPRAVYGEVFFHEMQVWVSRGYVVFFTNIRGSDGRDDAFADIRDRYGEIDFRNLMDFTDAVLAKYPNIDPEKLCETGGSYGGFMTNWIVGHTDRFCCVASQRSIANWVSKLFISDIGLWFNADQQGAKNVYRDTEALWRHSPLRYAQGAKTPMLFIHSDQDYRCPLPEGMQMMQAMAVQDVETRLVIFHGENHELSRGGRPLHRIRRLKEISDWFDKHTK